MTITRTPLTERLWARITKGAPQECWLWSGPVSYGYGKIGSGGRGGKILTAHRVVYEEFFGKIPEGLHVLHRCDTPACCNPAHLWAGTPADNVADCIAKGRARRGDSIGINNFHAKLTVDQVLKIRKAPGLHKTIAKRYGVTKETIGHIKAGKTWKHI